MSEEGTTTAAADTGNESVVDPNLNADTVGGGESAESVEQTPADAIAPASPGAQQGSNGNAATEVQGNAVDVDAELTAKEKLADKLDAGEITYEEYAKSVTKHDRAITQAQRQMTEQVKPLAQSIQAQKHAASYWSQWGKGKDIAQTMYAKVPASAAQTLYAQAVAEVNANPRYKNRPEIDPETIIYDKFLDKLDAESKKPGAKAASAPAPAGTRAGGSQSISAVPQSPRTAREKLDQGAYGDLDADMKRLGI